MNLEKLEQQLSELPLYYYSFINPETLEFSQRIRYIYRMSYVQQNLGLSPGSGRSRRM